MLPVVVLVIDHFNLAYGSGWLIDHFVPIDVFLNFSSSESRVNVIDPVIVVTFFQVTWLCVGIVLR